MSDPSIAFQTAIISALNSANLAAKVYDDVPEKAPFPFVKIGDDHIVSVYKVANREWFEATSTIHVFSRAPNKTEAKIIAGAVRDALNVKLAITGFTCDRATHEGTLYMTDPDGLTKHAVITMVYELQTGP